MIRSIRRDPGLRWVLLLALLAFAIRVCSIWSNLPDVPNPDEFKTIWPPLRMAYGNWQASGGYPPFYMYILLVEYAAIYAVGTLFGHFAGTTDFARTMIANPTPLYLMGRATSVLLGSATVLVLYAIGRRLFDRRVGLLAAAFLTFDTVHICPSGLSAASCKKARRATMCWPGCWLVWLRQPSTTHWSVLYPSSLRICSAAALDRRAS
jgi:dolichyl-phosphate-mannose--protein O-mannosyl transferase